MTRSITQEDVESVFRFFQATGITKEELFQVMNEWTPWVTDAELERLWRDRSRKVVLQ